MSALTCIPKQHLGILVLRLLSPNSGYLGGCNSRYATALQRAGLIDTRYDAMHSLTSLCTSLTALPCSRCSTVLRKCPLQTADCRLRYTRTRRSSARRGVDGKWVRGDCLSMRAHWPPVLRPPRGDRSGIAHRSDLGLFSSVKD